MLKTINGLKILSMNHNKYITSVKKNGKLNKIPILIVFFSIRICSEPYSFRTLWLLCQEHWTIYFPTDKKTSSGLSGEKPTDQVGY